MAAKGTIEEKLYRLSRPCLIVLRLAGYFPFSMNNKFDLSFKYLSAPFIWATVAFLIATLGSLKFCLIDLDQFRTLVPLSPTEDLTQFIQVSTLLMTACISAANAVYRSKRRAEFWQLNCTKLKRVVDLVPQCDFSSEDFDYGHILKPIARRLKFHVFRSITFAIQITLDISHAIIRVSQRNVNLSLINPSTWLKLLENIPCVLIFTTMVTHQYVCIGTLVAFYLGVYSSCLSVITDKLKQLNAMRVHSTDLQKGLQCRYIEDRLTLQMYIRNCIKAYHLIENLVADLTKEYTFDLLASTSASLIIAISSIFFAIYRKSQNSKASPLPDIFISLGRVSVYAMQSYHLCSAASKVSRGCEIFMKELVKVDNEALSPTLQMKVAMTVNLIANKPLKVAPGGFIVVQRSLFAAMVMCTATYLIILVQFNGPDR